MPGRNRRGRGARQGSLGGGRGRDVTWRTWKRRGRGVNAPIAPSDDSGYENEAGGSELDPHFQQFNLLDGESDDVENEGIPPPTLAPINPPQPPNFVTIAHHQLQNPQFTINQQFVCGGTPQSLDIGGHFSSSPTDIVLRLSEGVLEALLSYSNSFGDNLSMKDMHCYHSLLTLPTALF